MNNYFTNYDYIGATGNYPINDYIIYSSNNNFIYTSNTSNYLNKRIDDIDIETSNIASNISSNYTEGLRNELWEVNPNNSKCLIKSIPDYNNNIHTYIINSNIYGEIRFKNIYTGDNIRVNIDKFGKLNVYHIYDLLKPTISEGWKDVESEITNLIILSQINGAEIIVVQGQIAGLDASINFILGELTTLTAYNRAINLNLETLSYGIFNNQAYQRLVTDTMTNLTGYYSGLINQFSAIAVSTRVSQFTTGILIPAGVAGVVGSIMYAYDMSSIHNLTSNALNCNVNLTNTQRREILEASSNLIKDNYNSFNSNFCNMSLEQGFINSNIITTQFIPELKSNKIMLGNITTPNVSYQMEMTGDLNLNMLYLNSTSLSSLLNQKQDNISATQPIFITTANIGLNYDSSLTKIGNNLSVVKTASLPLVITGNNWTLNYDSTLELSGNNLKVAAATASKWTTSGINIYNNNTGNVGINTTNPSYKLHIEDGSLFVGDSAIGNGSQTDNGYRLIFDSSYTATGANKCNKILLHKNDNAPTYIAGFGVEAQGLTYSVWTGGYHNFYTSTTSTSGGFLSCSIYRDNFRFYGSTNAGAGGVISNGNNGTSAYSYLSLANDSGNGILFLNSSTKTTDGGENTLTLRNDITGGDLRLSANLDTPYIYLKKSSGNVGIGSGIPAYNLDVNGSLNSTSLYIVKRLIQTHLFNNTGRPHTTFTDFNTPTDFGCHFIQGPTNGPGFNTQYYSMSLGLGSEYGDYKCQLTIPRNVSTPYLCIRYMEGGNWNAWNRISAGLADNASSSTFSIRSPNESTSSILYLGTPYNSSAPSKCAIIAQAVSSYSRSKLHFCLNGTADNSSIYQAGLADGSFSFDYDGNMGLMNQSVPNIGGGDYALHLGNSAITTTSGNLIIHKRNNSGGTRLFRFGYDGYFWTTIGDYGYNNSLSSWLHQFSFPYNCPTNSCYLTGSGGMVILGTLTQNSDQRIKTDIKTIENALWKVQQLRGVEYTHIIEQTRHIGLIAQEVENIIPEVVFEGQKNDLKSVSYGNLVALLIEGMKEMKEEINNLNKRIEILENK